MLQYRRPPRARGDGATDLTAVNGTRRLDKPTMITRCPVMSIRTRCGQPYGSSLLAAIPHTSTHYASAARLLAGRHPQC